MTIYRRNTAMEPKFNIKIKNIVSSEALQKAQWTIPNKPVLINTTKSKFQQT